MRGVDAQRAIPKEREFCEMCGVRDVRQVRAFFCAARDQHHVSYEPRTRRHVGDAAGDAGPALEVGLGKVRWSLAALAAVTF